MPLFLLYAIANRTSITKVLTYDPRQEGRTKVLVDYILRLPPCSDNNHLTTLIYWAKSSSQNNCAPLWARAVGNKKDVLAAIKIFIPTSTSENKNKRMSNLVKKRNYFERVMSILSKTNERKMLVHILQVYTLTSLNHTLKKLGGRYNTLLWV